MQTIYERSDESLTIPEWTLDCQGKQDLDGVLVELSSRYWPSNYQSNGLVSTKCSILVAGVAVISREFEAPTEAGVKALTEAWAQERLIEALRAVKAAFCT